MTGCLYGKAFSKWIRIRKRSLDLAERKGRRSVPADYEYQSGQPAGTRPRDGDTRDIIDGTFPHAISQSPNFESSSYQLEQLGVDGGEKPNQKWREVKIGVEG